MDLSGAPLKWDLSANAHLATVITTGLCISPTVSAKTNAPFKAQRGSKLRHISNHINLFLIERENIKWSNSADLRRTCSALDRDPSLIKVLMGLGSVLVLV